MLLLGNKLQRSACGYGCNPQDDSAQVNPLRLCSSLYRSRRPAPRGTRRQAAGRTFLWIRHFKGEFDPAGKILISDVAKWVETGV
jgi:hypothetical protein